MPVERDGGENEVMALTNVFGWAILCWSIGFSQGVAGLRVERAERVASGVVSGVVQTTDAHPQPVAHAIITLSGASLPLGLSTVSDDTGGFVFSSVPSGIYSLAARKPGFLSIAFGAVRPGRTGQKVRVVNNSRITDVTLLLQRGAVIAGRVTDAAGHGVDGAQVSVFRVLPNGESLRSAVGSTDDGGEFRLFGLGAGDYYVAALIAEGTGQTGPEVLSTAEINSLLEALESGSVPARKAGIGQSAMVNVAPVFYIDAFDPSVAVRVPLGPGEERGGIDIVFRPAHTVSVTGSVLHSDPSIFASTTVTLARTGPQLPINGGHRTITVRPDLSGAFRFDEITPGRYLLLARGMLARQAPAEVFWGQTMITIDDADTSSVPLILRPGRTMAGRISMSPHSKPRPKLNNMRVSVSSTDVSIEMARYGFGSSSAATTAQVGPDGQFEFRGLRPASYSVSVTGVPFGSFVQSALVAGKDVLDGVLDLTSEEPSFKAADLIIVLSDQPASIAGHVVVADPLLLQGASVVIIPTDRDLWHIPSRRIQSVRILGEPGATFKFANVPPGEYYISCVRNVDDEDLLLPGTLEEIALTSVKVVAVEGSTTIKELSVLR